MPNAQSTRKDVKKAWLGIKMIINMGDCTKSELVQLEKTERKFYNNLIHPSTESANPQHVKHRRHAFENSDDMQEMLSLFWFVVSQDKDTTSNELTKNGYLQLNLRIQR